MQTERLEEMVFAVKCLSDVRKLVGIVSSCTGLDYKAVSFPGLVNLVPAVAYHFCLNLPAAFLQPGNSLIFEPYICDVTLSDRQGV